MIISLYKTYFLPPVIIGKYCTNPIQIMHFQNQQFNTLERNRRPDENKKTSRETFGVTFDTSTHREKRM